ncbi:hypothetical protein AB1P65_05600 [Roseibium alexandrii]
MISQLSHGSTRMPAPHGREVSQNAKLEAVQLDDTKAAISQTKSAGVNPVLSELEPELLTNAKDPDAYPQALSAKLQAHSKLRAEEGLGKLYRDLLAKTEAAEPTPARDVDAAEAAAVREALKADGSEVAFPEDGVFMSLYNGLMYTFTEDGAVTAHEPGVPRTQEEKASRLSEYKNAISELEKATGGLSLDELRANFEAASQRLNEIVDRAAATGTSGQIYDTVA